jgi:hypothetical protein
VRIVRFIVTGLAVVAGLIGAMVVMALGFIVFLFLRLFGRPATRPRFQTGSARARPAYSPKDDVIDVTATDVKD